MISPVLANLYTFFFVFILFGCSTVCAQFRYEGQVVDESTQRALVGATVEIVGSSEGTSAGPEGKFGLLSSSPDSIQVEVRMMSYHSERFTLYLDHPNILSLGLQGTDIAAVSVQGKAKYSNRNNPAVELIDLVIKHKRQNRLSGKEKIRFEQYDKVKLAMVNPPKMFNQTLGAINNVFNNLDTITIPGKELVTLYQEENLSNVYSQKDPSKFKKIVDHQVKTEFDSRYVNNPNIQSYINYLFQPVDVYDESIFVLNKLILSPIADNGKIYYKYYITDTIAEGDHRYIKLRFVPRNAKDLLFFGDIMVSMDGRYAVRSVQLNIDKRANLNWIQHLNIKMVYSPNEEGMMLLDTTQLAAHFGGRSKDVVYGEQIAVFSNYDVGSEIPEEVFSGAPVEVSAHVSNTLPHRPVPLSAFEKRTYADIEALNESPSFRTALSLGYLLAQGYYSLGKFELGPLEYLYSRNNIEGNRIRIGGRTNQALTDKAYAEGYLAYGERDNQLKYFLRSAVSLNGRSIVTFPAHYIEGTIQHDILEPGRQMSLLKGDSFFMSFRRNRPTKWFDTDAYRLRHVIEFGNHVSVSTGFLVTRRETIGNFRLISSGDPDLLVSRMNTSEASVELRWAPFEKFYYRNLDRNTVVERHPVFNVEYTKGFSGVLGGQYDYDAVKVSASKRLFLNQLGFADFTLTGGKIWGTLPYTLLHLPNVRQKFDRHDIEYDLMNSMEFAADEYVKFSFLHQMNGFLFNKVPFLRRLKLREIWGGQMFYGTLSDNNNPQRSDAVVEFDTDADGIQVTHGLGRQPYWEGSAGIDNIFRILRVEYVKRLTHRELPNISNDRVRVTLRVNF